MVKHLVLQTGASECMTFAEAWIQSHRTAKVNSFLDMDGFLESLNTKEEKKGDDEKLKYMTLRYKSIDKSI